MVRYKSPDNGKSQGLRALKSEFPDVFAGSAATAMAPDVYVQDSIYVLRNTHVPEGSTWRDYVRRFAAVAEEAAARWSDSLRTVVLCFDKSRWVPLAKSEEQHKRNVNRAGTHEHDLPPLDVPDLDGPVPTGERMKDYFDSRQGYRQDVIAYVCYFLLAPHSPARMQLPRGVRLVVDGHCFGAPMMRALGDAYEPLGCIDLSDDTFDGMDEEQLFATPLVRAGERVRAAERARNRIGEGDFAMFHLAHAFAADGAHVVLYSVDSDLVYLALVHEYRQRFDALPLPRVRTHVWKRLHFRGRLYEDWTDVSRAFDTLRGDGGPLAPLSLVLALSAAGGDFIDCHLQVPHERFLRAYLEQRRYIGDLLAPAAAGAPTGRLQLCEAAHTRLLKCAYVYAAHDTALGKRERGDEVRAKLHDLCARVAPDELDRVPGRRPQVVWPRADDVRDAHRQLAWYWHLCRHVGEAHLPPADWDLLEHGYRLGDPAAGAVRGNVERRLADESARFATKRFSHFAAPK